MNGGLRQYVVGKMQGTSTMSEANNGPVWGQRHPDAPDDRFAGPEPGFAGMLSEEEPDPHLLVVGNDYLEEVFDFEDRMVRGDPVSYTAEQLAANPLLRAHLSKMFPRLTVLFGQRRPHGGRRPQADARPQPDNLPSMTEHTAKQQDALAELGYDQPLVPPQSTQDPVPDNVSPIRQGINIGGEQHNQKPAAQQVWPRRAWYGSNQAIGPSGKGDTGRRADRPSWLRPDSDYAPGSIADKAHRLAASRENPPIHPESIYRSVMLPLTPLGKKILAAGATACALIVFGVGFDVARSYVFDNSGNPITPATAAQPNKHPATRHSQIQARSKGYASPSTHHKAQHIMHQIHCTTEFGYEFHCGEFVIEASAQDSNAHIETPGGQEFHSIPVGQNGRVGRYVFRVVEQTTGDSFGSKIIRLTFFEKSV